MLITNKFYTERELWKVRNKVISSCLLLKEFDSCQTERLSRAGPSILVFVTVSHEPTAPGLGTSRQFAR